MSQVLLERDGPVAIVTLSRPERHNSLTPGFLRELLGVLRDVAADPSVRAVVLQANGRTFSTGGDALGFVEHARTIETYGREIVGLLNQTIMVLVDMPAPVVAAVHGALTGGSLGFVLGADIVLVAPEATFTPYYSVVGPSPDGGWAGLLPLVIGRNRAAAVLMLNESITAQQAVDWGLAYAVVPAGSIRDEALRLAHTLAGRKPGSIRHTRRLLYIDRDEIAARLAAELEHFVQQIGTDEAMGGFRTFVHNLRAMRGLAVGREASLTRSFTAEDVAVYRALSGDAGLAFGMDETDAVPGPLLAGLFSCLLGTELPGRGTNWLKQSLAYPAAAAVGETVTATVRITRLRPEKALVNLETICTTAAGETVCVGEALVLVRDLVKDDQLHDE